MSNDISSMYTKDQNKKAGRRGYLSWKHEKVTIIPPAAYGDYILQDRRNDSVVNCFVFNNRSYSVNYWHLR